MQCLKCNAERNPQDFQCPKCGVYYAKVEAALEREKQKQLEAALEKQKQLEAALEKENQKQQLELRQKARAATEKRKQQAELNAKLKNQEEPKPELAILNCHACNNIMAKELQNCPHCGAKKKATEEEIAKNKGCLYIFNFVFIFFFIISFIHYCSKSSTSNYDSRFEGKTIDELHNADRYRGYNNADDLNRDKKALDDAVREIQRRGY